MEKLGAQEKEEAMDNTEVKKMVQIWSLATTALLYCYYIASKIPKATLRLISIAPVVYLFIILSLHLTSLYFVMLTVGLTGSLAIPRLLLFAFDEGPLSPLPPNPLLFIAIASLPVKRKQDQNDSTIKTTSNPPTTSFFSFLIKLLLLALWIYMYVTYREGMHHIIVFFLLGGILYFGHEIVLAVIAVPARAILDVEMETLFNHPYISTSLQDFWGRRWNLMINNILRQTVYKPVRSISTPVIGSNCASRAAVLVTFAVSGLMHEALYFYLTRAKATWEVTGFFVLHGVCVATEVSIKNVVRDRWRLHPAMSWLLTMTFLAATAHWLFLPQLYRNGVLEKVIRDIQSATIFTDKVMKNFITTS